MTLASLSFAALYDDSLVSLAGYLWMVSRRGDGAVELSRTGEPRLPDVTIMGHPDANNAASTYQATVRATDICELAAHRDDFDTAEGAVTWATGFEFATRQVGSLTWYALAPDAPHWHAVIGASVAEIVSYERGGSPSYAVKRRLKFGTQSVEFSITDMAYTETPKNIVSFEQASAIALTMPDYVMELMRTA